MYNLGAKDLENLRMKRNSELNNTETGPLSPAGRLFTPPDTLAVSEYALESCKVPLSRSELRGQAAQR